MLAPSYRETISRSAARKHVWKQAAIWSLLGLAGVLSHVIAGWRE
jgi:hypothetical protein